MNSNTKGIFCVSIFGSSPPQAVTRTNGDEKETPEPDDGVTPGLNDDEQCGTKVEAKLQGKWCVQKEHRPRLRWPVAIRDFHQLTGAHMENKTIQNTLSDWSNATRCLCVCDDQKLAVRTSSWSAAV